MYLTGQLNKLGLAYLHFIEPRVAGNMDCDVKNESQNTERFRKIWKGTFISAGEQHLVCNHQIVESLSM